MRLPTIVFSILMLQACAEPQPTPQELPTFSIFLDQNRADQSVIQEALLQTLPNTQLDERRAVFVRYCRENLLARADVSRLFPQVQAAEDIPRHCTFLFDAGHEYNFMQYIALIDPSKADIEERYNASLRETLSE